MFASTWGRVDCERTLGSTKNCSKQDAIFTVAKNLPTFKKINRIYKLKFEKLFINSKVYE